MRKVETVFCGWCAAEAGEQCRAKSVHGHWSKAKRPHRYRILLYERIEREKEHARNRIGFRLDGPDVVRNG